MMTTPSPLLRTDPRSTPPSPYGPLLRGLVAALSPILAATLVACSSGTDATVADASGSTGGDSRVQNDGGGGGSAIQTVDDLCWWEDCAADTWCVAGTPTACTPVTCLVPNPAKDETAWQITKLTFLPKTVGCDLNKDGVADNALAALNQIADLNKQAADSILAGRYTYLLRPVMDAKGILIGLDALTATVDKTALNAGCIPGGDSALKRCPVRLRKESYDLTKTGTCTPAASCSAQSTGGAEVAVTCDEAVPQPVIASPQVMLPGYDVQMTGTLPLQDSARQIGLHTAVATLRVCGLLKWSDANKRLDLVPAEVFKNLGLTATAAAVKKVLTDAVKPDVDTDDDGEADSVSFAVDVELREVKVVGRAQGD